MKRKHQRLAMLGGAALLLAAAAALALTALEDNIVFFHSPTDIAEKGVAAGKRLRVGGLVVEQSVKRLGGGTVEFAITDTQRQIPVTYRGVLPDLFREGQGVVAEGTLRPDGVFVATEVLAKHDERYMPPEVVEALKRAGKWQEGGAQ